MSWRVVLVLLAANGVSAATVASLQKEGDAIYDMSQAMPSLVTGSGTKSGKHNDLIILPCALILTHSFASGATTLFDKCCHVI